MGISNTSTKWLAFALLVLASFMLLDRKPDPPTFVQYRTFSAAQQDHAGAPGETRPVAPYIYSFDAAVYDSSAVPLFLNRPDSVRVARWRNGADSSPPRRFL